MIFVYVASRSWW